MRTDDEDCRISEIKRKLLSEQDINFDSQSSFFKQKLMALVQTKKKSDLFYSVDDIIDKLKLYCRSVQALKDHLPNVSPDLIDEVCDRLLDSKLEYYWEFQSQRFQTTLFNLLQQAKTADEILHDLLAIIEHEKQQNLDAARRARVVGNQVLDSSILRNQLVAESVQRLVSLINPMPSAIEIFGPVNQCDQSRELNISAAAQALQKPNINHVMFPVGPGHWYWVTISKTTDKTKPYAVEVFDPYCGNGNSIYNFLDPILTNNGIKSYSRVPFSNQSGLIKPQRDGYSCGYFAAAYAHLKVKQLDASANCNQNMIDALKTYGNAQDYLRDMCLHVVNPDACPKPHFIEEPKEATKKNFKLFTPLKKNPDLDELLKLQHAQLVRHSVWNRRGVQRAVCLTLLAETLAVGLFYFFNHGAVVSFPPLALLVFLVAVATIYLSNKIEPLTFSSSKAMIAS